MSASLPASSRAGSTGARLPWPVIDGGLGAWGKMAGEAVTVADPGGKAVSSLTKVGAFLGGSGFVSGMARGLVGNVLTQGVAVTTRLQSKFDFAGVAAAGPGGGVSGWIGGNNSFGHIASRAAADGLASATARSIITGTSFGDNIIAVLPSVIGQAIGNAIGGALTGPSTPREIRRILNDGSLTAEQKEAAIVSYRMDKDATRVGRRYGADGRERYEAIQQQDAYRSMYHLEAQAYIAGNGTLDPEKLIRLQNGQSSGSSSGVVGPGEYVISGKVTFGHRVVRGLTGVGEWYGGLSSAEQTLVDYGSSFIKGPIGAMGSWAVDQALSVGVVSAGLEGDIGEAVATLGGASIGFATDAPIFDSDDGAIGEMQYARAQLAASGGSATEALNLIVGGATILSIGALIDITRRATGIDGTGRPLPEAAESLPVSRLAQGLEFEANGVSRARVEAFLPGQSTQRLSVRAFNADGTLAEGRTVLDMAGSRIDNGVFGSLEFKLSTNAPLTARQQLHLLLLQEYGGVVVGRNGVPIGLPAGARIPLTGPVRINGPTLPQPGQWWK